MSEIEEHLKILDAMQTKLKEVNKESSGFDDMTNKINKSLSKNEETFGNINDATQDVNSSMLEVKESSKKNNTAAAAWGTTLSGVKKVTDGLRNSMNGIFGVFLKGMGILSFADAISDAANLHQEFTDLSFQMGKNGEDVANLEKSFYKVQRATGMLNEEVSSMMKSLIGLKVPGKEIQQLSIDSLNLSKVTGANTDRIAQMTGNLSKMGKLGQKSITSIMGSIVDVQREFGMTSESVNALTDSISTTTSVLKNMGKSSGDIEDFQKGAIKLAGAFESVGIEASSATQLIDRMLDPSKLQDNAMLFAKMGISMEEAMNGDLDGDQMLSGLQNIGAELQNMSGPQAAALADAYGMPLQQLRQLGNMDMSQLQDQFGGMISGSDELAAKAEEQATATRKMQEMWNGIKASLGSIVSKFMPLFDSLATSLSDNVGGISAFIEKILNPDAIKSFTGYLKSGFGSIVEFIQDVDFSAITNGILTAFKTVGGLLSSINPKILIMGIIGAVAAITMLKKKFFSVNTDGASHMRSSFEGASGDIGHELEMGVVGGLEMAAEKGSSILREKLVQAGRFIADDHQRRLQDSHGYAAMEAKAAYQKQLSGGNTFGWAKSVNKTTAKLFDTIKEGATPVSILEGHLDKVNNVIKEKMKLNDESFSNEINHLSASKDAIDNEISSLDDRREVLIGIGAAMSDEQQRELKWITNRSNILDEDSTKRGEEINTLGEKRSESELKYLKQLSDEELVRMRINANSDRDGLDERINDQLNLIESLEQEQSLLERSNFEFEDQIKSLRSKGNLNAEELLQIAQLEDRLESNNTLQRETEESLKSQNDQLSLLNTESSELEKNMENVNKATEGMSKDYMDGLASKNKSFGKLIKDSLTASWKNLTSKFTGFTDKVKNSFSSVKKSMKEAFSKDTFKEGAKYLLKQTAKAGLNIAKGLFSKGARSLSRKNPNGSPKKPSKLLGRAKKIGGGAKKIGGGLATAGLALFGAALAKSEKGQAILTKMQEKLGKVVERLTPVIETVMESLMPVFDKLIEFLGPVIDQIGGTFSDLMTSLMPVISDLMTALMPMVPLLGNLAKSLLPPLLKVLGFLLVVLGNVIKAVGSMLLGLAKIFPSLKETGEAMTAVGEGFISAGKSMSDSVDRMADAAIDLKYGLTDTARELRNNNAWTEASSNISKALGDVFVDGSKKAYEMSVKELAGDYISNGKRSDIVQALKENIEVLKEAARDNLIGKTIEDVSKDVIDKSSARGETNAFNFGYGIDNFMGSALRTKQSAGDLSVLEEMMSVSSEGDFSEGKFTVEKDYRKIFEYIDANPNKSVAENLDNLGLDNKTIDMLKKPLASGRADATNIDAVLLKMKAYSDKTIERVAYQSLSGAIGTGSLENELDKGLIKDESIREVLLELNSGNRKDQNQARKLLKAIELNEPDDIDEILRSNATFMAGISEKANVEVASKLGKRLEMGLSEDDKKLKVDYNGGETSIGDLLADKDFLESIVGDPDKIDDLGNLIVGALVKGNSYSADAWKKMNDNLLDVELELAKGRESGENGNEKVITKMYPMIIKASNEGFEKVSDAETIIEVQKIESDKAKADADDVARKEADDVAKETLETNKQLLVEAVRANDIAEVERLTEKSIQAACKAKEAACKTEEV